MNIRRCPRQRATWLADGVSVFSPTIGERRATPDAKALRLNLSCQQMLTLLFSVKEELASVPIYWAMKAETIHALTGVGLMSLGS
jgi:hypothetical protein